MEIFPGNIFSSLHDYILSVCMYPRVSIGCCLGVARRRRDATHLPNAPLLATTFSPAAPSPHFGIGLFQNSESVPLCSFSSRSSTTAAVRVVGCRDLSFQYRCDCYQNSPAKIVFVFFFDVFDWVKPGIFTRRYDFP